MAYSHRWFQSFGRVIRSVNRKEALKWWPSLTNAQPWSRRPLPHWGDGPGGRRSKLSKFPLGKFTMPIRREGKVIWILWATSQVPMRESPYSKSSEDFRLFITHPKFFMAEGRVRNGSYIRIFLPVLVIFECCPAMQRFKWKSWKMKINFPLTFHEIKSIF